MITKYVDFQIHCDICRINGCLADRMYWDANPDSLDITTEMFTQLPLEDRGARWLRKVAKKYGWVRKSGKDICPKCYANMS